MKNADRQLLRDLSVKCSRVQELTSNLMGKKITATKIMHIRQLLC